ncbi:hypothetical protein GCM10008026_17420 [Chelatococcus composti]|nr:hypothetical protein GCM10008026_17420 [Chelatococcus composti]
MGDGTGKDGKREHRHRKGANGKDTREGSGREQRAHDCTPLLLLRVAADRREGTAAGQRPADQQSESAGPSEE